MGYEYTTIAAPSRGEKAKEAKTPTDRYALALTSELNRMAADGWEYVRADVLPSEERSGLAGRATVYHNLLVFRRAKPVAAPEMIEADKRPKPEYPAADSPAPAPRPVPHLPEAAAPQRADHVTGTELSGMQPASDDSAIAPEAPPAQPPAARQSQVND